MIGMLKTAAAIPRRMVVVIRGSRRFIFGLAFSVFAIALAPHNVVFSCGPRLARPFNILRLTRGPWRGGV